MFERFTDRARRVVVLAQEECRLLGHDHIGTEHLLLGLLHEADGVAAKALESIGVSLEGTRASVEARLGRGTGAPSGHLPFSARAKTALELSLREALELGHNYIGTEHVLLGLVREGEGVAALTLAEMGADVEKVRTAVIGLLGGHTTRASARRRESRPVPPTCPGCGRSLDGVAASRTVALHSQDDPPVSDGPLTVVVVYCQSCGRTLGVFPS